MHRILFLALLLFVACSVGAQAQTSSAPAPQVGNCTQKDASTRPECPAAIAFLEKLQTALKSGDQQAIASLVRYPLRANYQGVHDSIKDPAELLRRFSEIFDPGVTCAILSASSTEVWGNSNGFSIAQGNIWFDAVSPEHESAGSSTPDSENPMKIISINYGSARNPCKNSGSAPAQ